MRLLGTLLWSDDSWFRGSCVGTSARLPGPGRRAEGGWYETPGVSFITLNAEARICRQFDMFDLAHQMHLCDELDAAGLLSPQLKAQWVSPMKERLLKQLG